MPTTRRCYIHIGLPKTGTSYLQSILRQSEEAVTAQGLDLLPRTFVGRRYLTVALRDRLNPETDPPAAFRVLERLRKEAADPRGDRALVSQEILGALTPEQIRPLLDALPGYEPHVIVTVRDLARTLPSGWQQETQAYTRTTLDAFVAEFMDHENRAYRHQRRRVLSSVLDRWEQVVPPERIHVVTVPPRSAGSDVLLDRFCSLLGVDPATLDRESVRENTALGAVQAELMRRVNVALGDRLTHPRGEYEEHAKKFLARQVLLPQGGRPPRLPESAREWFTAASEALIERVSTGGYDVVGDLDDLRPDPASFVPAEETVTDGELVEAAVDAMAAMLVDRARNVAAGGELGRSPA
jgi:hypothetical protein